jgi:hypothetical protein
LIKIKIKKNKEGKKEERIKKIDLENFYLTK